MKTYPIFLNDLAGRPCVVFGSNHEAERKIKGLLDCDASVTVIHPQLSEVLQQLFEAGDIAWRAREYRPGDLKNAFLAIASEPNESVNRAIWEEAEAEKVLFNAMDDVPHCTFVAGSVVRQGPLVISISTSGCAPALSVRLRQQFEPEFGPEYGEFLHLMKSLRPAMSDQYKSFGERRDQWYALVDGPLLEMVKSGRHDDINVLLNQFLGKSSLLPAYKSGEPALPEK